jgi:predicted ribosomally synthesized peptide with nif11-like leader
MSIQAANDFVAKVRSDVELQQKLDAIGMNNLQNIVNLGLESGFEFTAEEFQQAAAQTWSDSAEELDEADLEAIAGGGTTSAAGACFTYTCGVTGTDGTTDGQVISPTLGNQGMMS